jgi:hypothetical protein
MNHQTFFTRVHPFQIIFLHELWNVIQIPDILQYTASSFLLRASNSSALYRLIII